MASTVNLSIFSFMGICLVFLSATMSHKAADFNDHSRLSCSSDHGFDIKPLDASPKLVRRGTRYAFYENSWIRVRSCIDTTIRFTASADAINSAGAKLAVGYNNGQTQIFEVIQPERIKLPVKKGDQIFLGFINDYYKSASRYAEIQITEFHGHGCHEFGVSGALQDGVSWLSATRKVGLSARGSAPLSLCSPGQLLLTLTGHSYDKENPNIGFFENGKLTQLISVSNIKKTVSISTQSRRLVMRLVNPSNNVLDDRNLYIDGLISGLQAQ